MIPDSEHRILNSDRLEETMTMTAIGDSTPINSTDVAADTRDTVLWPSARTILTRELAATTAAGVFDAMNQQPSPVDQRAARTQPHPGALHRQGDRARNVGRCRQRVPASSLVTSGPPQVLKRNGSQTVRVIGYSTREPVWPTTPLYQGVPACRPITGGMIRRRT
jgi:hypothetical protein